MYSPQITESIYDLSSLKLCSLINCSVYRWIFIVQFLFDYFEKPVYCKDGDFHAWVPYNLSPLVFILFIRELLSPTCYTAL